jgi:UDP-N-acetylglucosamine acyltransferase
VKEFVLIHQTAVVSPEAKIGQNVKIGPYAVIGSGVCLCDNVEICSHVCVDGSTIIGSGTKVFPFAAIGFRPQDLKFRNERSSLIIGCNNAIREHVTMHPGTEGGRMQTVVGDNNLFMVGVHIAHDCIIGNNVVMGNNATLGGHVIINDDAIIGGLAAVHQFVRIGRYAIIGGMSGVERDVIPYGSVKGDRAHLAGLNIFGLRRIDIDKHEIVALRKAYDVIFSHSGTIFDNLNTAEGMFSGMSCVKEVINFMRQKTDRSFCMPRNMM